MEALIDIVITDNRTSNGDWYNDGQRHIDAAVQRNALEVFLSDLEKGNYPEDMVLSEHGRYYLSLYDVEIPEPANLDTVFKCVRDKLASL